MPVFAVRVSGLLVCRQSTDQSQSDTNIDLLLFKSDTVNSMLSVMKDWFVQTDQL